MDPSTQFVNWVSGKGPFPFYQHPTYVRPPLGFASLAEEIERHGVFAPRPRKIKVNYIKQTRHIFVETPQPQRSEFSTIMGEPDTDKTKTWPKYDPNPRHCTGMGQKYCLEQGLHSWFNHSQDSFYTSNASNLPEGFVEQ